MARAHASEAICARRRPLALKSEPVWCAWHPGARQAAFPSLRMTDAETVEIDFEGAERLSKAVQFRTNSNRDRAEMIRKDPARLVQVCKMASSTG